MSRWCVRSLGCLIALAAVIVAGACSPAADQVFPTARPTVTASPAPSPTISPVPPTAGPVTIAPTTGPEATSPIGLIPTSAPATSTPIARPISGLASIEYFTSDAPSIKPGETLTLFWSTKGVDHAIIYRLDANGKKDKIYNVNQSGSLEVATKADDRGSVQFTLSVGDPVKPVEQTLSIPINCVDQWFFNPQPGGCPSTAAIPSTSAQQNFQHGVMLWVQTQLKIYVLFGDGKSDSKNPAWIVVSDDFKDGQPETDSALVPPSGLLQPIRGFGLVWRSTKTVKDRLGWATDPEASYNGMLQGDATVDNGVQYIRAKDGTIFELTNKGASWKLITTS